MMVEGGISIRLLRSQVECCSRQVTDGLAALRSQWYGHDVSKT